ncbi:hypothetical protein SLE2022_276410 [Rubroshorea leprosula]
MDNFKYSSGSEGCSSSESGWTMYLASPRREDEESSQEKDDDNNNHYRNYSDNDDQKENSDDSMASDASSGPSHQQHKHKSARDNQSHLKQDKGDYANKCSSRKEAKKQEKRSNENGSKSKGRFSIREKYQK